MCALRQSVGNTRVMNYITMQQLVSPKIYYS